MDVAALRAKLTTVRDIEKLSCRVFELGVSGFIAGVALSLDDITSAGVPLLALSAVVLMAGMAWISARMHENSQRLYCPHCGCPNDVYLSNAEYYCFHCRSTVKL